MIILWLYCSHKKITCQVKNKPYLYRSGSVILIKKI